MSKKRRKLDEIRNYVPQRRMPPSEAPIGYYDPDEKPGVEMVYPDPFYDGGGPTTIRMTPEEYRRYLDPGPGYASEPPPEARVRSIILELLETRKEGVSLDEMAFAVWNRTDYFDRRYVHSVLLKIEDESPAGGRKLVATKGLWRLHSQST
jgi:hypothetical protein